jgi:hypothetical protein
VTFLETDELRSRQARLDRIVDDQRRRGGYIVNVSKDSRNATADEVERLRGTSRDGVPNGLRLCRQCHEYHGECLNSTEASSHLLVRVHCRCENHNRCARCAALLYERKLNASFYNPDDRRIWSVPGFCGLDHDCKGSAALAVI